MTRAFDDVCDLLEDWEGSLSAAAYHQQVEGLLDAMCPGEEGRAEVLTRSGSDRINGHRVEVDLVEAERRLRAAIADCGPTVMDPRGELVEVLRLPGRRDEFEALVRECLRNPSQVSMADTYATLGEHLELADELALAHRTYTIGLKHFDPALDAPEDVDEEQCLSGRFRVRRHLGRGMDAFDRAFEQLYPEPARAIRKRLTT